MFLYLAAKNEAPSAEEAKPDAKPKTEVNVAYPSDTIHLDNNVTLNATATYLLKSDAKANSTGYIISMKVRLGDRITQGSVLLDYKPKKPELWVIPLTNWTNLSDLTEQQP